jgi:tyrosyl-tRNA synthetase
MHLIVSAAKSLKMKSQSSFFQKSMQLLRKAFSLSDLKARNLLYQITNEQHLTTHLLTKQTIYTGFDPTAKSLHVGNLVTIVSLLHFMASGHQIIALIGGATGHIGDPSGKSDERKLLANNVVSENTKSITSQLDLLVRNGRDYLKRRGLETDDGDYKTLNNLDWFKGMTLLDFLSSAGRMSRVSTMVSLISLILACS